jgi:hypothetical protein
MARFNDSNATSAARVNRAISIGDDEMANAENPNATLTINEVAARINVTPRTIRKVLRANFDETPGRGGRYAIKVSDLPALRTMIESHTAKAAVTLEFPSK